MNVKDLMPDDLVMSFGQVTEVWMVDASHEDEKDQFINYLDAREFEPIPITPEILEKNRFVYDENREAWEQIPNDGYGICYEDNTYLFSLGIFDPFNRNSDITYHTIAEIKYVHELQHIIKQCGIKREIVL